MGDVAIGNFALLDGNMNDLMQPGAVAGGKNVGQIGLHPGVRPNAMVFEVDADLFQSQGGNIRNSAERKKDLLSLEPNGLAVVLESDLLFRTNAATVEQLG